MRNNAVKFNGAASALGIEATHIYEFVKETVEQNRAELDKMETNVRDQMSGKPKKKKGSSKKKSPGKAKAESNSGANIEIDGVNVNLGMLSTDIVGAESDSDESFTGLMGNLG